MAEGGVHLDRETFSCSICLELLTDPVTTSCGHSYCLSCIREHWDREDEKGIHSCPQCRKIFIPRPELLKNTMLAALVEQLKKTRIQAAPADHCYAGAEDVACDVCTGRKLKAHRSCLVCLVSFCENHLQLHYDVPQYMKHPLVEPSKNLQQNICSQHGEVMKMFCRSDQQCICHICCLDAHKEHETVSAATERREKEKELQESQQSIQKRIQDRQEELKELQQEEKNIKLSADDAVKHSQKMYSQLISLMEKRSSEVEQHIRSQQEAEVRRVKELEEKLEQEMAELRSKAAELQQLSHTEDHCRFLRNYSSASPQAGSTHRSSLHVHPRRYFEDVKAAVSESSRKIQELLRDTWTNISLTYVDVLLPPGTRKEFLRFSRDLTLDPNTAHTRVKLSEGNRRATWIQTDQPHPDHPDRFRDHFQVLSRESLTGRCYWEVKVIWGIVDVAVADKNISRRGAGSRFGYNDKSWALHCSDEGYEFVSDSVCSDISGPRSSTVGVYLDHPAGLLSFYSVSDSMTLLHTVRTSFTQPLHAGLGFVSSSFSSSSSPFLPSSPSATPSPPSAPPLPPINLPVLPLSPSFLSPAFTPSPPSPSPSPSPPFMNFSPLPTLSLPSLEDFFPFGCSSAELVKLG